MSRLGVSIDDGKTIQLVSHAVTDLGFRRTAPGGYAIADLTLSLPVSTFPGLSSADVIRLHDPRTGATVWEGYIGNPGEYHRNTGEGWELSLVGTSARAYWATQGYGAITRILRDWQRDPAAQMQQAAITQIGTDPEGSTAEWLVVGWPKGAVLGQTQAVMINKAFDALGIEVATIAVTVRSGFDGFDYQNQLVWSGGGAGGGALGEVPSSTSVRYTRRVGAGPGHPPVGTRAFSLRIQRTTETLNELLDDRIYTLFRDPAVRSHFLNRRGQRIDPSTIVSGEYVVAHDVAEDIVGRLLGRDVDPTRVIIEPPASPYQIDQLFYSDPISAGELLDRLCEFEPDHLWEFLESSPEDGRSRFNFRRWPTAPRYIINASHQPDIPGSDLDLCNRIWVSWTDPRGNQQQWQVTAAVPDLDRRGIVRDADPITLPEGVGSFANAQRVGWRVLQITNTIPLAGTAVVTGPIQDQLTGQPVQPWEIEPGYLVWLQEKGAAVRLTEVEYDDESQASRLTFGTPTRTPEQVLARASARTKRVGW